MAKYYNTENELDSEEVNKLNLHEIPSGEDYYITIIAERHDLHDYFLDKNTKEENNLTVIEMPEGGFGGGCPGIWEFLQPALYLLSFTAVVSINKGFFERLGSIFADSLAKKLSGHNLPSQIHICYPDENIRLTVVLPAKITEEEASSLNGLINEYVQGMKADSMAEVFFSPKERRLILFMSNDYN